MGIHKELLHLKIPPLDSKIYPSSDFIMYIRMILQPLFNLSQSQVNTLTDDIQN